MLYFGFQETYTLEQVCGGSSVLPSQEKTESMMMNLLLPLCIRVGSGRKGKSNCPQLNITGTASTLINNILIIVLQLEKTTCIFLCKT